MIVSAENTAQAQRGEVYCVTHCATGGRESAQGGTDCHTNSQNKKGPSNPEKGTRGQNKMVRAEGIEPPANGLKG